MNYIKIRRAYSKSATLEITIPISFVLSEGYEEGQVLMWDKNKKGEVIIKKDPLKEV